MDKIYNCDTKEFEELSLKEQDMIANETAHAALKRGYIIDTHNDRMTKRYLEKEGIVLAKYYRYGKDANGNMVEKQVDLVPLFKNTLCCINQLELDKDGKVYLSTWSIGGNVVRADVDTFNKEHTVEYLKEKGYPVLSCWLGRLELVA